MERIFNAEAIIQKMNGIFYPFSVALLVVVKNLLIIA